MKPARNDGQDDVVFVSDTFIVVLNGFEVAVEDWLCDCCREDADVEFRNSRTETRRVYHT